MYQIVIAKGWAIDLLPDEALGIVARIRVPRFDTLPDPILEIRRLTSTADGEPLGLRHPAIASMSPISDAGGDQRRYEVVFGRDAMKIARSAHSFAPALMPTTLRYLAERQGVARAHAPEPDRYDARREEDGRLPHEIRDPTVDPLARQLTERWGWAWPYYNTDDTGLLFARDLAAHCAAHPEFLRETVVQRDGVTRSMAQVLRKTLRWAESHCANPQGLFESIRPSGLGGTDPELPSYPVWMDSPDAIHRADGTLCSGPVACIELQAQYHDALLGAAALPHLGVDPVALRRRAERVQAAVQTHFRTLDRAGHPLIAYATERREGSVRALRVLKSNPAAALDSALFARPRLRSMVETILDQTFDPARGLVCPSGIRSLSSVERRFTPGRYHNGQVWPHDTHDIARGAARQGARSLAVWADSAVRRTCETVRHFPETIRGTDDLDPSENAVIAKVTSFDPHFGHYANQIMQPGQITQGWAAAAYVDAGWCLETMGPRTAPSSRLERHLRSGVSTMTERARAAAMDERGRADATDERARAADDRARATGSAAPAV